MAYYTSNEEHPIDIVNIASLEERVKARMDRGAFGYIREGAEDGYTGAVAYRKRFGRDTCRKSNGGCRRLHPQTVPP